MVAKKRTPEVTYILEGGGGQHMLIVLWIYLISKDWGKTLRKYIIEKHLAFRKGTFEVYTIHSDIKVTRYLYILVGIKWRCVLSFSIIE